MHTLENIKSSILKIEPVFGRELLTRVEIDSLPHILQENETIRGIVTGIFKNTDGVLVATEFRLIHLTLNSWTHFPYQRIESITSSVTKFNDGKTLDTIHLLFAKGKVEIRHVPYDTESFLKLVKYYIALKVHDPRFDRPSSTTTKQQKQNKPTKNRGRLLLILSLIVVVLGGAYGYFAMQNDEDRDGLSLGFTPTQFQQRWNQSAEQVGSHFKMTNVNIVSDQESQSFTYFITPSLKISGILETDETIQKLMLLGQGESELPLAIEQVIAVTQPELSTEQRTQIIKKLGVSNTSVEREDKRVTQNGIRYALFYPEKIGIVFEASAVK
ncbi:hypothetical protein [Ammoniphilus resinae]|uniref:Uncharacterized protein n=1 Tax=Ammoniphilus resinae TaxID=861532 RepID=A0ABS4GLL6_9BACL|nr:hypothetical protein [Ammoniphilus resinae]MBP1931163.1 hypothetical protein [Ammoniphilus resinae]